MPSTRRSLRDFSGIPCVSKVQVSPECQGVLPFQPFPLQEAVEVQTVEVVSKGSHTQIVVDKPRREQRQQGS